MNLERVLEIGTGCRCTHLLLTFLTLTDAHFVSQRLRPSPVRPAVYYRILPTAENRPKDFGLKDIRLCYALYS